MAASDAYGFVSANETVDCGASYGGASGHHAPITVKNTFNLWQHAIRMVVNRGADSYLFRASMRVRFFDWRFG